ncbi:MAG: hypothetical protein JKY52_08215 [Flavobacteriales bacterium]|nr:hypothetical protein [Flavobacteriales bacterium]MBL4753557.1 hypothetical protein [Flavobacteriales bacterium]
MAFLDTTSKPGDAGRIASKHLTQKPNRVRNSLVYTQMPMGLVDELKAKFSIIDINRRIQ